MDKLTVFQKALLNSIGEEYTNVPMETELTHTPATAKGRFTPTLRRCLIAAAVVLLLVGSVFAAYEIAFKPEVTHTVISFPETNTSNDNYAISFAESIAVEGAPESIETFYAPSMLSSTELDRPFSYLEDSNDGYYLQFWGDDYSLHDEDITISLENGLKTMHLQWTPSESHYVSFTQRPAKEIKAGKPFLNIQTGANALDTVTQSTVVIGEYEVFCVDLHFYYNNSVLRHWFWTDGNYLYELGSNLDEETMRQLFESVAPIDDLEAYLNQ